MCETERKLDETNWIRIEVMYEEIKPKRYYLRFSYFTKDGGTEKIDIVDSRNFDVSIEYVTRYSKKKLEEYCKTLKENKQELLDSYEKIVKAEDVKKIRSQILIEINLLFAK